MDLRMVNDTAALYASQPMQDAIRAASGLLPFHAWLGTEDLKDDHLVVAEGPGGSYQVAAIDFSYAMKWANPADPVQAPSGPPALQKSPDKGVVADVVARIETMTDDRIRQVVDDLPEDTLPRADRERIIAGLQTRRSKVRAAMTAKGWL